MQKKASASPQGLLRLSVSIKVMTHEPMKQTILLKAFSGFLAWGKAPISFFNSPFRFFFRRFTA